MCRECSEILPSHYPFFPVSLSLSLLSFFLSLSLSLSLPIPLIFASPLETHDLNLEVWEQTYALECCSWEFEGHSQHRALRRHGGASWHQSCRCATVHECSSAVMRGWLHMKSLCLKLVCCLQNQWPCMIYLSKTSDPRAYSFFGGAELPFLCMVRWGSADHLA